MQKQWEITCRGKTLGELREALTDALNELNGLATTKNVSVKKNLAVAPVQEEEDEYVDETEISTHTNNVKAFEAGAIGEVDSEGIPYDARIHSSSREKVANGTWRNRRGVDKALVEQVKASYRGAPVQSAPVQPQQQVYQAPVVQQSAPVAQPVIAPMPTMNSGHTSDSFVANFPQIFATLITEGKITQEYVNTLKAHFKVDQIWMISNDQKAQLFTSFVEYGLIQKVG